ncbi:MAG TPA: ABC transporter ATP-binding protein [Candidatus Syntrophosphaera sp.]|nr:MAG: Hemin import ATP-binding protein HmuV [Candidatus Cloacimonetes bacterium ADurb.Bin211]HOD59180.1 ABC transporter ATP-binding protein [Candidatus Syntrophosphaera sp.]HQM79274.1 ABC transporter ATP-binding protein [Candidatus Syntrophosphaera sp.]
MIEIEKLCYAYEDELVLKDVDLTLPENEFTVLAGPNGAGKSTLIYALLGFLKPKKGEIRILGRPLHSYKRIELARLIAFVPQESIFQFDYPVRDIVLMGRYPYLGLTQSWMAEDYEAVDKVLEQLSLQDYAHRFYSQLSGGEKQRVLIARALAQNTRYIFLDESLSQLDINHQIDIMILLRKILAENKKGILLISHNLNLSANFADRMVLLSRGRILGSGSPEDMMKPELLNELFGIELYTMLNPLSGKPNILYPGMK